MSPAWTLRTGRLRLIPVAWTDLADLTALKADPRVFAVMLGGVRGPLQTAEELAEDIRFWAARGYGIWTIRDAATGAFQGLTGLMERPDGRGVALRFALWPEARGRGLAREAAGAKITREPGPVKFGTTIIAFVEDPDGYKIELIQRA